MKCSGLLAFRAGLILSIGGPARPRRQEIGVERI